MCVCVCVCMLSHFSHVQLFVTLWTEPAKLLYPCDSPGKNNWSGLPCPPLWDVPAVPALDSLPLSHREGCVCVCVRVCVCVYYIYMRFCMYDCIFT